VTTDRSLLPVPAVMRRLTALLTWHGVPPASARATARVLVEGTARGYLDHGVERIFQILDGFRAGTLRPDARARTVRGTAATALVDAGHGPGHHAARQAMRLAVRLARGAGVAAVGVRNAGHLGVLGYYAELAARAGCVGVVMSSTSPAAVVPGGGRPVLGTNPLAFAAPAKGLVMTADFATTGISRGRLIRLRDLARPVPDGMAVDARGRPTADPAVALAEGGLLPLGGAVKGTLLALLVAVFTGPLIGGPPNVDVVGTRFVDQPPNKGDLFLAIDPAAFGDPAAFEAAMTRQLDAMTGSSPLFRAPGRRSAARVRETLSAGLPVSPRLAALLSRPRPPAGAAGSAR